MATIDEIADRAADYIEEHGWTQNQQRSPDGAVCMGHACIKGGNMGYTLLTPYVLEMVGPEYTRMTQYNDTPGRTKEEVIQVLREIANKYRPEQPSAAVEQTQNSYDLAGGEK